MASTIFNAENRGQEIFEANRQFYSKYGTSWADQYATLDRARQNITGQIRQAYAEATGQAYLQGQQQMSDIGGSALGSGAKQQLQSQLQQSMVQAYDRFRSQEQQAISEATSDILKAEGQISSSIYEAGKELGEKTAEFNEQMVTGYLGYINKVGGFDMANYKNYQEYQEAMQNKYAEYVEKYKGTGEPLSETEWRLKQAGYLTEAEASYEKALESNPGLSREKYLNEFAANKLNEDYFKTEQKAAQALYGKYEGIFDDEGKVNVDALRSALYDENGSLSIRGADMIDQLAALPSREFDSYIQWLSKNDKKLYEWALQDSLLGDANNAESAMKYLGADGKYSFMERFGGLNEAQTEAIFKDFDISLKEATKNNWEKTQKENLESYYKSIKSISDVYNKLKINSEPITITGEDGKTFTTDANALLISNVAKQTGQSIEEVAKGLDLNEYIHDKNLANMVSGTGALVGGTTLGAVAGAMIFGSTAAATTSVVAGTMGAVAGAAVSVPVAGWVIAGGAILASAGALIFGEIERDKANKRAASAVNEQRDALKKQFDQYAVQSAAVANIVRGNVQKPK